MLTVDSVSQAAQFIAGQASEKPSSAIVLGSGLGDFAETIEPIATIPFGDIPGFAQTTAIGHAGRLIVGRCDDSTVVAMQGRFHLYEGHSAVAASFPVRVMHALGAKRLVVSNAAGGLNPHYRPGDVMIIDDHINLMFRSPLVGLNEPEWGQRFPDMSQPYDKVLQAAAVTASCASGEPIHKGVYVGMLGPTYETRAEYRFCRGIGGDAVGMSTVPEVIAARQLGMRVFGVSVITNACSPDQLGETSGDEVVQVARAAGERLSLLVSAVLKAP